MTDDDKGLDKKLNALLPGARRRGRPPMGFTKALKYDSEVWKLRRAGSSPWRAKIQVAEKNRKTPEHISACVKKVSDAPLHDLWEHDETGDVS